jgi:NTP pyrophosphatase (non-canonical NTP hydrolase)
MSNINLNQYTNFVEAVTSKESNYNEDFLSRINSLIYEDQVNVPLLLTGVMGLTAESGEAMEIVKKIVFQGKPLNDDNIRHLKLECSDIMWYWVNLCRALKVDPYEIVEMNVRKLESRYPGGKFDPHFSENRKEGDL